MTTVSKIKNSALLPVNGNIFLNEQCIILELEDKYETMMKGSYLDSQPLLVSTENRANSIKS